MPEVREEVLRQGPSFVPGSIRVEMDGAVVLEGGKGQCLRCGKRFFDRGRARHPDAGGQEGPGIGAKGGDQGGQGQAGRLVQEDQDGGQDGKGGSSKKIKKEEDRSNRVKKEKN